MNSKPAWLNAVPVIDYSQEVLLPFVLRSMQITSNTPTNDDLMSILKCIKREMHQDDITTFEKGDWESVGR